MVVTTRKRAAASAKAADIQSGSPRLRRQRGPVSRGKFTMPSQRAEAHIVYYPSSTGTGAHCFCGKATMELQCPMCDLGLCIKAKACSKACSLAGRRDLQNDSNWCYLITVTIPLMMMVQSYPPCTDDCPVAAQLLLKMSAIFTDDSKEPKALEFLQSAHPFYELINSRMELLDPRPEEKCPQRCPAEALETVSRTLCPQLADKHTWITQEVVRGRCKPSSSEAILYLVLDGKSQKPSSLRDMIRSFQTPKSGICPIHAGICPMNTTIKRFLKVPDFAFFYITRLDRDGLHHSTTRKPVRFSLSMELQEGDKTVKLKLFCVTVQTSTKAGLHFNTYMFHETHQQFVLFTAGPARTENTLLVPVSFISTKRIFESVVILVYKRRSPNTRQR
jgi:hypothetical protein